jgi:hypothetical protein
MYTNMPHLYICSLQYCVNIVRSDEVIRLKEGPIKAIESSTDNTINQSSVASCQFCKRR